MLRGAGLGMLRVRPPHDLERTQHPTLSYAGSGRQGLEVQGGQLSRPGLGSVRVRTDVCPGDPYLGPDSQSPSNSRHPF